MTPERLEEIRKAAGIKGTWPTLALLREVLDYVDQLRERVEELLEELGAGAGQREAWAKWANGFCGAPNQELTCNRPSGHDGDHHWHSRRPPVP